MLVPYKTSATIHKLSQLGVSLAANKLKQAYLRHSVWLQSLLTAITSDKLVS